MGVMGGEQVLIEANDSEAEPSIKTGIAAAIKASQQSPLFDPKARALKVADIPVELMQKKITVLHYDVPPSAAHLFGNTLYVGLEPVIPFLLPLSENEFLDR